MTNTYSIYILKDGNPHEQSRLHPDISFMHIPETIKSSLIDKLNLYGGILAPVYEDFLVIAMSIFAADKNFKRCSTRDAWTRNYDITIPVMELDRWVSAKLQLEKLISFLSGDIWKISFVKSETRIISRQQSKMELSRHEAVCLFSGGLDSFCGAISSLRKHSSILLVGNEEYPLLNERQKNISNIIQKENPDKYIELQTFTSFVYPHYLKGATIECSEDTTRTRSLLFMAAGLCYAGLIPNSSAPLFVPENGFVALNLPMTPNRMGSCSTRTTHPKFIDGLNLILEQVGISNKVINPYKTKSKSDVVRDVENTNAFKKGYDLTISCSHPTQSRYHPDPNKRFFPQNCGYCYPCLIRRSSLKHLRVDDKYLYDINSDYNVLTEIQKGDLNALLIALNTYQNKGSTHVHNLIEAIGNLEINDRENFAGLYEQTMNDFLETITNNKIKKFAGLK